MACSCMKPNYQGPAVGIWSLALALQFAAGVIMIYTGADDGLANPIDAFKDITSSLPIADGQLETNGWKAVYVMGWVHLLIAVVSTILAFLGMFVCGVLGCPLCVVGYIQSVFCIACAVTCAVFVRAKLDNLSIPGREVTDGGVFDDGDIFFGTINSEALLIGAILSFCACIIFPRAQNVSSGDSVPGTYVTIASLACFGAAGALFAVGGGGVGSTPAFAAIWVTFCVVAAFVTCIANCCSCVKVCNILVGILYGCATAFGVITLLVAGTVYTKATDGDADDKATSMFLIMENGKGLIAVSVLCIGGVVNGLMATFYSFRSLVCCCGKGVE